MAEQQGDGEPGETAAMARDAGSWMRKRGCLFWVIGGAVALIALSEYSSPDDNPAAQQAAQEAVAAGEAPPTKVSPAELQQAYAANEVAAQAKYGGRVLEVSGRIAAITLDFADNPVLEFVTGAPFEKVNAGFDKTASGDVAALAKGQKVTVRCGKISEVIGTPMLGDCALVR